MIYVSLSAIPQRLKNLSKSVDSLLNQTKKPDKIFINIPFKYKRFNETVDINQIPKWFVNSRPATSPGFIKAHIPCLKSLYICYIGFPYISQEMHENTTYKQENSSQGAKRSGRDVFLFSCVFTHFLGYIRESHIGNI